MQFLEKLQPLALLVLRVAVGLSFVTHGYPKLITDPAGWVRMMPQFAFPDISHTSPGCWSCSEEGC